MDKKRDDGSRYISIIGPENLSSTTKITDSSTIDHLIAQGETLLKNNFSKYDVCIKYQEKLRLQIIKSNENYKYLRAWLESANEDCFRMKSNDGHFVKIYETLLKNNIVKDFVEHGVVKERLNLEFLSTMMQIKDLRKSLSEMDGDISSIKSDYEEMQYREVLMQISFTEESHEYLEFGKKLRLKSVSVMNECEHLNKCLTKTYEDICNLKSKHDELTRNYGIFLQNTSIKEFLEYVKNQEKLPSESSENFETEQRRCEQSEKKTNSSLDNFSAPEKIATNDQSNQISSVKILSTFSISNTKIEFFPPSVSEEGFSELSEAESCEKLASFDLRLNEYQEKLIAEQRRREQIEKEFSSLDEFSDKLCRLLLKYQRLMSNSKRAGKFTENNDSIQNSLVEKNSVPFSSYSVSEICATGIKEGNIEKLSRVKVEPHLDAKSNAEISESNASDPNVEESNDERDDHLNEFHFLFSSVEKDRILPVNEKKENLDNSLGYYSKSHFNNYNSSAKKFVLVASNQAAYSANDSVEEHRPNRIEKNQILSSPSQVQASISSSMNEKREKTANRFFHCKRCDKTFSSKKNHSEQKCPTCDVRDDATIPMKNKSASSLPSSLIKSTSVVAKNSSVNGSSNPAKLHSSTTQKPLAATEVSYDSKLHRSPVISSTDIKNLTQQSQDKIENEWFCCSKCQKPFTRKKNEPVLKCPTCSVLDDTADPMETKSAIDDTTLKIKKNNSAVKNSPKSPTATHFQCDMCDRSFAWMSSLHHHKLSIHQGQENYKCPICDKIFTRTYDMRRHVLLHTSQRPYKCSFCLESFNYQSHRCRHIRKVHGVDPNHSKTDPQEAQIVCNISKENLKNICINLQHLKKNVRNIQKAHKVSRKTLPSVKNNHDTLTKKLRNIQSINQRRYCCAHCGQRYHQKQNMFHHICMEHFSGALEHVKCIICEHVFPTKQLMVSHRQAYHTKK